MVDANTMDPAQKTIVACGIYCKRSLSRKRYVSMMVCAPRLPNAILGMLCKKNPLLLFIPKSKSVVSTANVHALQHVTFCISHRQQHFNCCQKNQLLDAFSVEWCVVVAFLHKQCLACEQNLGNFVLHKYSLHHEAAFLPG